MHPAKSVIFLTTLIGLGQGLFIALFACELSGLVQASAQEFYVRGSLIAVTLLVAGLVASFFHLGRPERAWRSAAMWRTSWLSREVILLPATMLLIIAYGAVHYFGYVVSNESSMSLIIGAIAALSVLGLYLCTGMIYACLRFLQEWATPWTVINFLLMGSASGLTLSVLYASYFAPQPHQLETVQSLCIAALGLTALAWITRVWSLLRNARIRPRVDMQSAIGIRHGKITQQTVGFMGGSFNTREFFHGRTMTTLTIVKWLFLVLAFFLPLLMLLLGLWLSNTTLFWTAFICQFVGLLLERWYFFADAKHPQNLYYQTSD